MHVVANGANNRLRVGLGRYAAFARSEPPDWWASKRLDLGYTYRGKVQ